MSEAAKQFESLSGHHGVLQWQAHIDSVFDQLELVSVDQPERFAARLNMGGAGVLRTGELIASAQQVHRQVSGRRHARSDELVLMLQVQGSANIEQAGNSSTLQPGDLVVFDNARPYTLNMNESFVQHMVLLQRDHWGAIAGQVERQCAQRLNASPSMRVMAGLINNLVDEASSLKPGQLEQFALGFVELYRGAVDQNQHTSACLPRNHVSQSLFSRIQADVNERLADSNLTPLSVANTHGVSVRYVHRLFGEQGTTMMNYVRDARLTRAADLLRNATSRINLGRLCAELGFTSETTFRRAFRRRFGVSPSAYAALPK